jgi:hypothetical protein
MYLQLYKLVGAIYELRLELGSDALIYVHTKFHKVWFRHSKVDGGDAQTHRQHGDGMSLLLFFENKENRLKINNNNNDNKNHVRMLESNIRSSLNDVPF